MASLIVFSILFAMVVGATIGGIAEWHFKATPEYKSAVFILVAILWTAVVLMPVGHAWGLLNIMLMLWCLAMKVLHRPFWPHKLCSEVLWAEIAAVSRR